MAGLFSKLSSIFVKCGGKHRWNKAGECEACGTRCPHPAWIAKSIGDDQRPSRRVLVCMDCEFAVADRRQH
ncbi:MAG TPA: hypothetical protein VG273_28855 [Bryobacteraceae bacterium]|jgi:hypothetical protein|nr:hypothetical protein [Bryobacteraceae bacterium]